MELFVGREREMWRAKRATARKRRRCSSPERAWRVRTTGVLFAFCGLDQKKGLLPLLIAIPFLRPSLFPSFRTRYHAVILSHQSCWRKAPDREAISWLSDPYSHGRYPLLYTARHAVVKSTSPVYNVRTIPVAGTIRGARALQGV